MPRSRSRHYINPTSIAVLVATAVGLLMLLGVGLYRAALAPVSRDTATRLIHIESMRTKQLARTLKGEQLVRSAFAFRLLVQADRALGKCSTPKAGYYDLSPSMSSEEILARLCEGKVARRKVTFPEGFTVAQMGERLQRDLDIPADTFVAAADGAKVSRALNFRLPHGSLEGFLFPSTYAFNVGEKPDLIVSEMVATLNESFVKPHQTDIRKQKLTVPELVIVASLIEREARVAKDRALIAGVIMNRLAKGMPLQIDATVQYALPQHKTRLSRADTRVDSPYNTYRHKGLPPGAICNPGLDCLLAALHPAKTAALFYVARRDGTHIFTKTYQEHLQAIKQLRK